MTAINIRSRIHNHKVTTLVAISVTATTGTNRTQSYTRCDAGHADCSHGPIETDVDAAEVNKTYKTFTSTSIKNIRLRSKHSHTFNYEDVYYYKDLVQNYKDLKCPYGHSCCVNPGWVAVTPGPYQNNRARSATPVKTRTNIRVTELHYHTVGGEDLVQITGAYLNGRLTCASGHSACVLDMSPQTLWGFKSGFNSDEKAW
ncbi:MAG: hypothetical protein ACXQS2_00340 [Methermicoccaceae archaeon]